MLLRRNLIVTLAVSIINLVCIQAQNVVHGRYRFNHPPSIENIESVPVTVVYDSGDVRKEKSIKLSSNFQNIPEVEAHPIKIDYEAIPDHIGKLSRELTEMEKVENNDKGNSLDNESITRTSLVIPVSVIFDTKSKIGYDNEGRDKSKSRTVKKQNKITSGVQKAKIEENINDQVVINHNEPKEEKQDYNETSTSLPIPINTEKERRKMRTRPPIVPIVTEKNLVYAHSGIFHFSFEGGDGTKVFEEGSLKTINDDTGEAVYGGFEYKDREGNDFSLSYTADENGYRPIGAHLPTPPPIPPAIARALAYLATKSITEPTEATGKFV